MSSLLGLLFFALGCIVGDFSGNYQLCSLLTYFVFHLSCSDLCHTSFMRQTAVFSLLIRPYAEIELYSERSRESSKLYCRKFGAAGADDYDRQLVAICPSSDRGIPPSGAIWRMTKKQDASRRVMRSILFSERSIQGP